MHVPHDITVKHEAKKSMPKAWVYDTEMSRAFRHAILRLWHTIVHLSQRAQPRGSSEM